MAFYTDLLGMAEFLRTPVRQLSLGQKMRANLAIALLHDPDIVYLDEPTIGLDVVAKDRVRKFIREINREKGTTIILTTHDMRDIEEISDRLIMIDHGHIIYDGALEDFKRQYCSQCDLIVDFADEGVQIQDHRLRVVAEEGRRKHIIFDREQISVAKAITMLARNYNIGYLSLKEPDIEQVVRTVYITRHN